MKVYLSAISLLKHAIEEKKINPSEFYALESYYSIARWQIPYLSKFKGFLLDSGAFTFMSNSKKHGSVDWLSYADRYADFIKDNNIRHYFELDIDSIVGIKYVHRLRERIEGRCGVPCIPVWHKSRGKEYFESIVRDYKYVALGGIVSKEIPIGLYERMFPWFITTAHRNSAKIHGLGYTRTSNLKKFHFDSVDSTAWIYGSRYGEAYIYNNGIIYQCDKKKNIRCIDPNTLDLINFNVWLKYSHYAENNL